MPYLQPARKGEEGELPPVRKLSASDQKFIANPNHVPAFVGEVPSTSPDAAIAVSLVSVPREQIPLSLDAAMLDTYTDGEIADVLNGSHAPLVRIARNQVDTIPYPH